jgi:hypothetical protein
VETFSKVIKNYAWRSPGLTPWLVIGFLWRKTNPKPKFEASLTSVLGFCFVLHTVYVKFGNAVLKFEGQSANLTF